MRSEIVQMADIIHDSATFAEDSEFGFLHLLLSENSFLCQHLSEKLTQICAGMTERIFSMPDRCSRIQMLHDIDRLLLQEFNAIPLYQSVLQVTSSENVEGLMLDEEGWIDLYAVWLSK